MTVPRPLLLAEDKLFGLISVLREFGVPIAPPRHIDFLRGVARLEVHDLDDLYWIGRITLVSRAEDIAVYDHIFREWFADNVLAPPENVDSEGEASDTPAVDERAGDLDTMDLGDGSGRHASADELIANRTFPPIGDAERAICVRIEEAVRTRLPTEPTRRHRPAHHGRVLDLRQILRAATRTGGEVVELAYRGAPRRSRKLLVLIDVSGSLKADSPSFLRFAHAVVAGSGRAEVFTFGTRLTRITSSLRHDDVDDALRGLTDIVFDFDGGTRIGGSFQRFLESSRRRTMARGAVVIVVSDGLERGDPAPMAAGVERIARLAHRLIWLTPLAGDPAYRPLTKAMTVVEPSLDRLGSSASLEHLLAELSNVVRVTSERRRGCARQTTYCLEQTPDQGART